jgi:multimeric flavodoxin WrbA
LKEIGISGSPRANGNSEVLLQKALEPFKEKNWEVVEFYLSKNNVLPCDGCDSCMDSNKCKINDDMQILYNELKNFDAMIIASPTYFRNVSAQLKALIDRTYALTNSNFLKGKVGGAIAVGRGEGGGQSFTLSIIHNFFLSSGMYCVPAEVNGVSAVADKAGEIINQPKRLRQARILGENILGLAESISKRKNN